jgi:hypothetical protein
MLLGLGGMHFLSQQKKITLRERERGGERGRERDEEICRKRENW